MSGGEYSARAATTVHERRYSSRAVQCMMSGEYSALFEQGLGPAIPTAPAFHRQHASTRAARRDHQHASTRAARRDHITDMHLHRAGDAHVVKLLGRCKAGPNT